MTMRRLIDRIRWSRAGERELDEEIRTHLALEAERLEAEEGLPAVEARVEARRRFGSVALTKEDSRAVWGFGPLDSWARDARFALRLVARAPLFALVVIASLALGVGASVAAFALLDTVLVRPLPVSDPQRLVLLRWTSPPPDDLLAESVNGWLYQDQDGQQTSTSFSHPAYLFLRDRQSSFTDLLAFAEARDLLVGRGAEADIGAGQYVSGNYFRALGLRPAAGRLLLPTDDRHDAEAVAVISDEGWRDRFGRSPSAIGARVLVNRVPVTIVGVMPRGFRGCLQVDAAPEFTLPLALQARLSPGDGRIDDAGFWWVQVMGRLKPDVTSERAAAELSLLFDRHAASLPARAGVRPALTRLRTMSGARGLTEQRRELERPLRAVAALVGLVLLVACANVAALLLARGTSRSRELSLRLAIGAGRFRLARQLVTESIVLSLLGGAFGLVAAGWFVPMLLSAAQPQAGAGAVPVQVGASAVVFGAGLSLLVGLGLGLITLVGSVGAAVPGAVRDNAAAGVGRTRLRFGKVLVAGQIALSLLLLVMAGLFAGTLRNLQRVDTGIRSERLLQFRVEPGLQGYEGDRRRALLADLQDRLSAIPGVRAAGFSRHGLFTGASGVRTIEVPGEKGPALADAPAFGGTPVAWVHIVGGRFLEALGVPLLSGRALDERDSGDAPRVALVNRAFARTFFGERSPLGRTFSAGTNDPPVEIVGVVGDARYTNLRQEPPPTIYVPYGRQLQALSAATFYLRTGRDPESIVPDVRRTLRAIDPGLPVLDVMTMGQRIERATERERRVVVASGFFSTLAVVLACIGLYGLMAYAVSKRTGELGVRLALGASPGRVVRDVLGETGAVVAAGLIVGLAATLAASRLVRAELFGVVPADPFTLAAGTLVVGAVALAAGYLPARRASRVDPLTALRSE
ncbi:MAG: macB 2 [Acidobacteria bacterium]|nr:macB 2 [Acidobacteriota bacterium]